MSKVHTVIFYKYCMEQFVQILLMVMIVYATMSLAMRTMLGPHTRVIAVLAAILVTCLWFLTYSLS
jgi:hypothetical protein